MADARCICSRAKAEGLKADRPTLRAEVAQDQALESCVE